MLAALAAASAAAVVGGMNVQSAALVVLALSHAAPTLAEVLTPPCLLFTCSSLLLSSLELSDTKVYEPYLYTPLTLPSHSQAGRDGGALLASPLSSLQAGLGA